jgi:DNA-binding NarL/FixJ family response regulator
MAINLAIVEDNKEILHNLRLMFSYYNELHIAAVYSNAEDFLKDLPDQNLDVVIMDINLPGLSGIKAVETAKPLHQDLQFLMCTIYEDEETIFEALCAGASGYLLKNTAPEVFLAAIKDVHAGGSPMSPNIARKVVSLLAGRKKVNSDYESLSQREREILDLLAKGFRYKEIADQLFISVETVRKHIRNIYEKLQVKSRTEALIKTHPR